MRKNLLFRRLASVAVMAAAAAGTMLAGSPSGQATPPTILVWGTIEAGPVPGNNMAIHVPSAGNNVQVVLQPNTSTWAGQWQKFPAGPFANTYQFQNRKTLQCLDILSIISGTPVVQDVCDINNPQQWWLEESDPVLAGALRYLNMYSFKYLTVPGAMFTAGTGITQSSYVAGFIGQNWRT